MSGTLLCIILDTHPDSWNRLSHQWRHDRASSSDVFLGVLERLVMFMNALLSMREDNGLFLIAAHPGQSHVVTSSKEHDGYPEQFRRTDQYRDFADIDRKLLTRLRSLLSGEADVSKDTSKCCSTAE
jgi:hypothetical protein